MGHIVMTAEYSAIMKSNPLIYMVRRQKTSLPKPNSIDQILMNLEKICFKYNSTFTMKLQLDQRTTPKEKSFPLMIID